MHANSELVPECVVLQRHLKQPQLRKTFWAIDVLPPYRLAHAVDTNLIFHIAQDLVQQQKRVSVAHLEHHIDRVEVLLSVETDLRSNFFHQFCPHHRLCIACMDLLQIQVIEEYLP